MTGQEINENFNLEESNTSLAPGIQDPLHATGCQTSLTCRPNQITMSKNGQV